MKTHNISRKLHPENLRKLTKPVALCISALFIISMLSALALTPVQARIGTPASYTYRWYQRATPTPTPTPTPTSIPSTTSNLTPFPTGWEAPSIGGTSSGWSVGLSGVTNVVLDNSVLYNGQPTIRISPTGSSIDPDRENDGPWITVHPGDHLVFTGWIKTSASSIGDTYIYHGCAMGLDFYGAKGRITGCSSPTGKTNPSSSSGPWPSDNGGTFVSWGKGWTQVRMDFVVQSQYPADYLGSGFGTNFAYSPGTKVTPTALIPFFSVMDSSGEQGVAWFAGAVLYINP